MDVYIEIIWTSPSNRYRFEIEIIKADLSGFLKIFRKLLVLNICSKSVPNEIHPLERELTTIRKNMGSVSGNKQLYFCKIGNILINFNIWTFYFNHMHSWRLNNVGVRGADPQCSQNSTCKFVLSKHLTPNPSLGTEGDWFQTPTATRIHDAHIPYVRWCGSVPTVGPPPRRAPNHRLKRVQLFTEKNPCLSWP